MIAVVSDDRRPFFGINGGGRLARPTARGASGTDETGERVKGAENPCDDAGLAVVVEPSEAKGEVGEVGGEVFAAVLSPGEAPSPS